MTITIKGKARMRNASSRVRTFSERFNSIGHQSLPLSLFVSYLHDVYEMAKILTSYGGFKDGN
jgi:hypothetical protein